MRKNALIILGFLVAALSLLTLPSSWKAPTFFILGAAIVLVEYRRLYSPKKKVMTHRRIKFSESPEVARAEPSAPPSHAEENQF